MHLRSLLLTLAAFAGGMVFTSCQPGKPSVKIGINAELTGEMPAVGASCKQAAELFADQLNAQGGIAVGGKKIPLQLVVVDDSAKADQSASAAQRLISQEDVLVMVGPNASSCAIPAAEIAESLGCLMISPWSTNPKTTVDSTTGKPKMNVFRACFTDRFEAPVLAAFATANLKAKTAAILYDMSSEAPTSQSALFKEAFEKAGGKVVAMETYTTGDRDFSAQLTKLRETSRTLFSCPPITMTRRLSPSRRVASASRPPFSEAMPGVRPTSSSSMEARTSRAPISAIITPLRRPTPRRGSSSPTTRRAMAASRMTWRLSPMMR